MTEDVGEFGDIFFNTVKCAGKEMPEVMRKDLAWADVRVPAKLFHFSPYVRAADRFACFGDKNRAAVDMMAVHIFHQLLLKCFYDEYGSGFAFAVDFGKAVFDRFNCNKLQLADAYTRAADRLKNE